MADHRSDLGDRLRAAAGVPARPRTTPGKLRALVRRRRRMRRAALLTAAVLVIVGAGTGVALLERLQVAERIEFADAPTASTAPPASDRPTHGEPERDTAGDVPPTTDDPAPPPDDRATTAPGGTAPACTGPATGAPPGSSATQIVDVDGDGHRDTMWLDASRTLGVVTAAGDSTTFAVESAAPSSVSALAVDANDERPVEFLVSDGRTVQLLVFDDCAIHPVINTRDDRPWLFDRGFRGTGTGVGCVDIDGERRLVGLNITGRDGDTVSWSRTVVRLDGRSATVGRTDLGSFERPGDDRAITLLSEVTCGDLTLDDDGITTPRP